MVMTHVVGKFNLSNIDRCVPQTHGPAFHSNFSAGFCQLISEATMSMEIDLLFTSAPKKVASCFVSSQFAPPEY